MTSFHGHGSAFRTMMELDSVTSNTYTKSHADAMSIARQLEGRCDRLALLCEALWTMVRDYGGFTENELLERINLIDLEDGKLDGKKKSSGPAICPKCAKPVSKRFNKCIYCSTELQRDPFE
jgi:hypothetical protein